MKKIQVKLKQAQDLSAKKRNSVGWVIPQYKTAGSVGCDLIANIEDSIIIRPQETIKIPTGTSIEIPEGYEAQVLGRSGMSLKGILCHTGTIDTDYRGEISVILTNQNNVNFTIECGDRIAQLVFLPIVQAEFLLTPFLSETKRGKGDFGSTGK